MSNDQLTELKTYLDKRFAAQDARFDKIDQRFAAQDAKFDQRFAEQDAKLDKRFAEQDEKLDRRFAEQDAKLDKRFAEQDKQLEERINLSFATFMGQLTKHFDKRFDALEAEARANASKMSTRLDGIVKRLDRDDQERAAMNRQLDRHERWHHKTADKVGLQLEY